MYRYSRAFKTTCKTDSLYNFTTSIQYVIAAYGGGRRYISESGSVTRPHGVSVTRQFCTEHRKQKYVNNFQYRFIIYTYLFLSNCVLNKCYGVAVFSLATFSVVLEERYYILSVLRTGTGS